MGVIAMAREEWVILAIAVLILILLIMRYCQPDRGKITKRYQIGRAMTIGSRQVQEDSYGVSQSPNGFLAVLADGMGRNYGGKVSSGIAVDVMKDMFAQYQPTENPAYFFRKAYHRVNREILSRLDDGRGGASVGSVLIRDNRLYYAVAGNVKIAVCRNGALVPVSTGHTIDMLVEDRFMEGSITREDALQIIEQTRIYNFVGQDGFREIELIDKPIVLKSKDIVVLMSDGIYDGMEWKELEDILSQKKKCQQRAYEIVEVINADKRTEKDNASILLIEGFQ